MEKKTQNYVYIFGSFTVFTLSCYLSLQFIFLYFLLLFSFK